MKKNNNSRRDFLKKSIITSGSIAALSTYTSPFERPIQQGNIDKLPRKPWIATFSQRDLRADTANLMVDQIIKILTDNVKFYQLDIICLPEIFPFVRSGTHNLALEAKVNISIEILEELSDFAKQHNCYLICPVYTSESGKFYNSAVVFDRAGIKLGEYRKIYITEGEIEDGISPGPIDPPVFETDFGKIGIQICYDIMWDDSWKKLREKGAEIVFWPSAFAGGQMVNAKAWQNMYAVVSSTWDETSKICDISGEVITQTGRWERNIVTAPLNLEKVFLHTWPYFRSFEKIKEKYGRNVLITTFHEEQWSIIESLSPDVLVADIMKDFNLRSKNQLIHDSEIAINKVR